MTDVFFALVVWIALGVGYFRAWQQQRSEQPVSHRMWAIFACMALAFIFRTDEAAHLLNPLLKGQPVAFWFKMLFVITAACLYLCVLQQVQPPTRKRHEWLLSLSGLIVSGNTLALLLGWLGWLTPLQAQYTMMTLSDLLTLLYMILMFLPVNLYLFQQEDMAALRIKYIATIIFCAAYIPAVAITTVFAPVVVLTGHISPIMYAIPLAPIVFFCILIQLLPYRYVQKLFYVETVYLYYRLKHLEQNVMALAGRQSQLPSINLLNGKLVERATYVALIGILDYSYEAAKNSERGRTIYAKVMSATEREAEYTRLVRAIARVTP